MKQEDIQTFLRFFSRRRSLTYAQRAKFERLLARDLPSDPACLHENPVAELLRIWEEKGLEAAVKRWEVHKRLSKQKSDNYTSEDSGIPKGFNPDIDSDNSHILLKEGGISENDQIWELPEECLGMD